MTTPDRDEIIEQLILRWPWTEGSATDEATELYDEVFAPLLTEARAEGWDEGHNAGWHNNQERKRNRRNPYNPESVGHWTKGGPDWEKIALLQRELRAAEAKNDIAYRSLGPILTALGRLPAWCKYHGKNVEGDDGPCCDTGEPALRRREAVEAAEQIRAALGGGQQ